MLHTQIHNKDRDRNVDLISIINKIKCCNVMLLTYVLLFERESRRFMFKRVKICAMKGKQENGVFA